MQAKVVITGFAARHYDELLDIFTLWWYPRFIRNAIIRDTSIRSGAKVAELGVGNGRNAILFTSKIGPRGEVVGFDISPEMLHRAKEKTGKYENIHIVEHDIRKPYPSKYTDYFDAALIAFVFHGFPDNEKEMILSNLAEILKRGGKFYILDYMQVNFEEQNALYRGFMRKFECPLAIEFLKYDLEENLKKYGFVLNNRHLYLRGLIQLAEFVLT